MSTGGRFLPSFVKLTAESTRVHQSYLDVRNQFGAWEKALKEHRRPDRFMITSEWIIISLLEAIDNYISARLQNIGKIYTFYFSCKTVEIQSKRAIR